MTETRTIRVRTPEDVLALVPATFGFHPTDSLVMLGVSGARGLHARIDLPHDGPDVALAVDTLLDAARRNRVRAVVLVAFSGEPAASERAVVALDDALAADGVGVALAVRADGTRWYCLHCDGHDPGGCPPAGTPYDVGSHPITAQAVLDGRVIHPDRAALQDSLSALGEDDVAAVGEAAGAAERRAAASGRSPLGVPVPGGPRAHLVQEGRWVRSRVRRRLRDGQPLDDHDVGRMIAALTSIEVRDVAWSEMDRSTAPLHVELWRDVVRRSPEERVAAPAALLGFAAWLSGDGALAWCAVERCQQADPGYGLAGLVTQALAGAVPPETWTPPGPDALTLFAG